MDDDTTLIDNLKEREKELILEKVSVLTDWMNEIEEILNQARQGKFKDETPVLKDGVPKNIHFILPNIMHSYEQLSTSSLPYMEFIGCFEVWIMQLQVCVALNKHHLIKNKTLLRHMEKGLETCRVIEHATRTLIGA